MPLRCDMRFEKGEKKKVRPKGGIEPLVDRVKRHCSWFTICTTGADASVGSAVLLLVLPVPWLTDVSSSQQWVIYSQTNGAVSNYTYFFRFVWFVVVFSDLLFCFRDCCCVFWIVILFFIFAFAFVICYFVFRIVICFALLVHRRYVTQLGRLPAFWRSVLLTEIPAWPLTLSL